MYGGERGEGSIQTSQANSHHVPAHSSAQRRVGDTVARGYCRIRWMVRARGRRMVWGWVARALLGRVCSLWWARSWF